MATRNVRRRPPQRRSLFRPWVIVAVVGVAAAAVVLVVYLSRPSTPPPPIVTTPGTYDGIPVTGTVLGAAAAPITVIEYSDFQCPYCRNAAEALMPNLKEEYIKTGKVRFEYKPVSLIGPESMRAAEAALCAGDQGKFYPYHDQLWIEQRGENLGAFRDDVLRRIAKETGLDETAFGACFDGHAHRAQIEANRTEAAGKGVKGTPTFFVNGEMIEGAVPWSQFKAVLDRPR